MDNRKEKICKTCDTRLSVGWPKRRALGWFCVCRFSAPPPTCARISFGLGKFPPVDHFRLSYYSSGPQCVGWVSYVLTHGSHMTAENTKKQHCLFVHPVVFWCLKIWLLKVLYFLKTTLHEVIRQSIILSTLLRNRMFK